MSSRFRGENSLFLAYPSRPHLVALPNPHSSNYHTHGRRARFYSWAAEQVQIPGPDQAGREAILRIHTQRMYQANRIDIPSSPPDTKPPSTASPSSDSDGRSRQDGYDSLVAALAATTNGFTGAELAGLVRAAASYALERAVSGGVDEGGGNSNALECRVTAIDFDRGLADVTRSKLTAARPLTVTGAESLDTQPSVLAEEGVREEGGVSVADEWAKLREAKARSSSAAPAASVAAVRAASELGGSLSSQVPYHVHLFDFRNSLARPRCMLERNHCRLLCAYTQNSRV